MPLVELGVVAEDTTGRQTVLSKGIFVDPLV